MTRGMLKSICEKRPAPCVSLMLPVNVPSEPRHDLVLRNLIREANEQLRAGGCESRETELILEPLRRALDVRPVGNQHGIVVYANRAWALADRLCYAFRPSVTVGHRFDIRQLLPLVPILDRTFWILALTETSYRLIECDFCSAKEVLSESRKETVEAEFQLQAHTVGTHQGPARSTAVFHSGGYDPKDEIRRFFERVSTSVEHYAAGREWPLLLMATERMLALYHGLSTHHEIIEDAIARDPVHWTEAQLHEAALPLAQRHFLRREFAALYSESAAAPPQISEVVASAAQGRVDLLLVADEAEMWGTFNPETADVECHAERAPGLDDLLNIAAVETIAHGGTAASMPQNEMPDLKVIAARYRY